MTEIKPLHDRITIDAETAVSHPALKRAATKWESTK
jgi:hypothetical protein